MTQYSRLITAVEPSVEDLLADLDISPFAADHEESVSDIGELSAEAFAAIETVRDPDIDCAIASLEAFLLRLKQPAHILSDAERNAINALVELGH